MVVVQWCRPLLREVTDPSRRRYVLGRGQAKNRGAKARQGGAPPAFTACAQEARFLPNLGCGGILASAAGQHGAGACSSAGLTRVGSCRPNWH